MPSLSDLQKFKSSFHNIGGQKADLVAKNLPFDDLELPESEPKPQAQIDESGDNNIAPGSPKKNGDTPPVATKAEPPPSGEGAEQLPADQAEDFDFSTLIGTQLGDPPPLPSVDEAPPEDNAPVIGKESDTAQDATAPEEFYTPAELLSNFSEEIDAIPPDFPVVEEDLEEDFTKALLEDDGKGLDTQETTLEDEPFGDFIGTESDSFDLGGLDDTGLSDEPLMADEFANSIEDTQSGEFDLDDLGDFGLSDDPLTEGESDSGEFDLGGLGDIESDGFNLDDLGDLGLSDEPLMADDSESDDFNFDELGDLGLSDDSLMAGGSESDSLNLDDLGDLGLSDDPLMADGSESGFGDIESDGFNLDDLGDLDLSDDPLVADGSESGFDNIESDGFNLDDLGDLGLSDEPLLADGPASDIDEGESGDFSTDALSDLGLSDDPFTVDGPASDADEGESGDFNIDALSDLGLSDDPFTVDGPASDADEDESGDFNTDALSDLGLSDDPFTVDGPASDGDEGESDDFDIDSLGDLSFSDEPTLADGPADDNFEHPAFANGSFGTEENAAGDSESEILGIDDFSFPDLDKALEKVKTSMVTTQPEVPVAPAKTGFWGKSKPADIPPAPDRLEDIKISEAEFRDLQETLANYPLNLRIACQEIIVEQDIDPAKMLMLIRNLVEGAPAQETSALAGEILGRTINIPKGFQKSSGEALAEQQATFSYIFINSFLPVFRIVAVIALLAASVFYLSFRFIYIPLRAESIYRSGYELLHAGDFRRANDRFAEAFNIHRNRNWFYRYAEAFIYHRQFALAEQKYEMLLRYFPRDRRGVLSFAYLQTNFLRNYPRADQLLRRNILDFYPDDFYALLATGDNSLAWAEIDPSRFEDARISFARLLEIHGWTPPVVERMLRFFIRTDNLREVLHLRSWFDAHPRRTMGAVTLAELGGYLLDKQFEEVRGVPNEFRGQIRGVPDILLEAVRLDPSLPEPHYHLSRFYHNLGQHVQERIALEKAIEAFENAREEPIRRLRYRIDAHQRYADVLIRDMEFIVAEEQLIRGIGLYEDGIRRRILSPSPRYGRLFAGLGDLEYFVKIGDMEAALNFYRMAERHGWTTPEMLFRMGSAYYQLENWGNALEYFFVASSELPLNHRVLFALGNSALKRGDYFAAQGFYNRLLNVLEGQRSRLPILLPNDRPEYLELAERLMMARNNAGVASERLAAQTGDLSHRTRALALYSEAQRAWDARTRDPATMIRSGSVPLPHLNMRNALHPQPGFEPQIFIRIDRDALETSPWEILAPQVMW